MARAHIPAHGYGGLLPLARAAWKVGHLALLAGALT